MNCQEVMELMQRHLDRDLDESEHETMMNHLQKCPDCAEMFDRLQQLSLELASLPKVMPPFSLVDSILPQLAELDRAGMVSPAPASSGGAYASAAESHAIRPVQRSLRRVWSWSAAGGVVAAGILLSIFVTTMDNGTNQVADESAMLPKMAASGAQPRSAEGTSAAAPMANMPESSPATDSRQLTSLAEPFRMADQSGASAAQSPSAEKPKQDVPDQPMQMAAPKPSDTSAVVRMADPNTPVSSSSQAEPVQSPDASGSSTPASEPVPPASSSSGPATSGSSAASTGDRPIAGIMGMPEPEPDATADNKAGSSGEMAGSMGIAAETDRKVGITAKARIVTELVSPDGKLHAAIDAAGRRVVVRTTGDKPAEVYASAQWSEKESAVLVEWADAVKVVYSVTTEDGKGKTVIMDTAAKTETIKP